MAGQAKVTQHLFHGRASNLVLPDWLPHFLDAQLLVVAPGALMSPMLSVKLTGHPLGLAFKQIQGKMKWSLSASPSNVMNRVHCRYSADK